MKTSQGKLASIAFLMMMIALLIMPMRVGKEDQLILTPSQLKMSPGGSYKLTCLLSSEDEGQSIVYESSDPLVATIAGDGTVNALSAGNAVISVKASGGSAAKCNVEVTGIPLSELQLNVTDLHIAKGQHSGLSVSYNTDASDTRLEWVSEDPTIATVDATGRVEGINGGHTKISVLAPNGKKAVCNVTVDVNSTAVSITPYDMIVGVGAQIPLKVSFLPLDSTDSVRSWVVSNPNVLSIDENGTMTATSEGTVHVSALTQCGLTAGMEVMVEAAPKDFELNPNRATIVRGDTLDMQLLFMNADGTMDTSSHPIVWTSGDPKVATIDAQGRVTGVGSGVTRITASSDGRTVSGYLTVRVYVREIEMDTTEVYLLKEEADKPIQLKLRTSPKDADNSLISFASNNTQVANVDENGLVTMTGGYGTAVITASAEGGASATFTVNVVTELPKATEAPETIVEETPEVIEEPIIEEPIEIESNETAAEMPSWSDEEDFDDGSYGVSDDGMYLVDEYGEIIYDEYGEPVYA